MKLSEIKNLVVSHDDRLSPEAALLGTHYEANNWISEMETEWAENEESPFMIDNQPYDLISFNEWFSYNRRKAMFHLRDYFYRIVPKT